MADKTGNTAGAGAGEGAGGDLGELNEEKGNGDELLSGEEQDDASGEGAEGVGSGEEGGDAGGEEVADADDEEEVEAEAKPLPAKGKAKAAAPASRAAVAEESSDDGDSGGDDDPELAKITSEMKEVEERGRAMTGRADQIRRFMKGQIKLTDGTSYEDLDEADRTMWRAELEDALRTSKEAAREFARVKATHAKKAEEVAEARTFGRVSARILGHIESIVSGIDGLTEAQQDAARGYILRKAQGDNARAFFERPLGEVEGDIRKQVGAGGRRGGGEKRTTAVLSAKKAPSSILPNKTNGGTGGGSNAPKVVGGLTQGELQVLRATHRTTYDRVVSGNATKQELAKIKSILKE